MPFQDQQFVEPKIEKLSWGLLSLTKPTRSVVVSTNIYDFTGSKTHSAFIHWIIITFPQRRYN